MDTPDNPSPSFTDASAPAPQEAQPATAPVIAATPASPQHHYLGALIALIIVLLAGCGALAYSVFGTPTANEIPEQGVVRVLTLQTAHVAIGAKGTASAKVDTTLPSTFEQVTHIEGDIVTPSGEKPGAAKLNVSFDGRSYDATTTLALKARGDVVVTDKHGYINITDASVNLTSSDPGAFFMHMILGAINGAINGVKGRWIALEDPETSADLITASERVALEQYARERSYLSALNLVGKEKVGADDAYHLRATITADQKLIDILKSIDARTAAASGKEVNGDIQKLLGKSQTVDFWMHTKTFDLLKTVTDWKTIDEKTKAESVLHVEAMISAHNKPLVINAPEGAKSMKEVMAEVMGGFFGAPSSSASTESKIPKCTGAACDTIAAPTTMQPQMNPIEAALRSTAREKSRDSRRRSDMSQIALALELYNDAEAHYPVKLDMLTPTYIPTIPVDPSGTAYEYSLNPSGKQFSICTNTEVKSDGTLGKGTYCVGQTGEPVVRP